jgi:DNA-3-methyladenine glycosylase
MIFTALPQEFYARPTALVARRMLGHWLLRRTPAGLCGGPIVETEAYLQGDPACHAFAGETARNRVMFGPPGRAYVYFIYGNHFCVNAVCRGVGHAEGVLIRAVEAEFGLEFLRRNRPGHRDVDLTNGPGKLCAALGIDRALNGADLCDPDSPLFLAQNPRVRRFRAQRGPVVITRRVGLNKGMELPLRFLLEASDYVSRGAAGK